MYKKILFWIFIFTLNMGSASELDSLIQNYNTSGNDSLKAQACFAVSDYFETLNVAKAIEWSNTALVHAKTFKNSELICTAFSYSNYYYARSGNYHKAIEMSLAGLKLAEKKKLGKWQASFSDKIGASYQNLEEYPQAILWLTRSLELHKKYSPSKISGPIGNLGSMYINIAQYDSAIVYLNQALSIHRKNGARQSMALTMGNIVTCLTQMKRFDEAEKMLNEAYSIRKEFKDQYGTTKMLMDFSWLYGGQKEYQKSINYADSARIRAINLNYKEFHNQAVEQLSSMYAKLGNYKKAFEYNQEAFMTWKEIHEQAAMENLIKLRTVYETDKVEDHNAILTKNGKIKDLNLKRNEAEISNQRIIISTAIGMLLILFLLVYFLNKWNKEKIEKNGQLSIQKALVEEKNEEILASIQYAKRIQAAILPQAKIVKEYLKDSFILYKPKDVVAGDFYWMEQKDGYVLFAAADCTGHGVPGAMVSVVCNNGLNRSVREHGLTDPGKILDRTREIIVEEFEKSEDDVKDGMDIAICSLKGSQLMYAGANNPLWIIRNGELIVIKADKQPIGKFDNPQSYKTHEINLEKGDLIYIFSDGYADQFGGEKSKKFKSTNFKKLLLSIQTETMVNQHRILDEKFEAWKDSLDQIDDVCVMGVRV